MATYSLTPSERRARAQALKEQRENRRLYNNFLQQQKKAEAQAEQERIAAINAQREKENQNFFNRSASTIGDIASNVITGAIKGLEGIYDLGAGIVGAVGGIFDNDFQDRVKSHISYDWTGTNIGDPLQELTKYSYTKDGGIIEGIASGIGQMLPAVAISAATAGIGGVAAGAAAKTASLATIGVSAAGNATEEAFKDGADYYKGLGYGLASGAVEVATEKMFGGATKGLFGKGMLDNVGKSVADTGIKRIAKNALEEGIEEITSELVNPSLKGIYKGSKAFDEYKSKDYWKGVAKAGTIGTLTALAYSGTVGYGLSKKGMGYVGKEADINDSLIEIETQKNKANNLFANDKLTEKNENTITSNLQGNYKNIEETLKKSSEKQRKKLIEKFSLESAFDINGSMKVDFATKIGLNNNVEQVNGTTADDSLKPLASLDKRYYTPSLRGSEQTISEDLDKITANLQESENEMAAIEGRTARTIDKVTNFTGELSDNGKVNYSKVKKGLTYLNKISGGKVNLVIVNPHDSFNGNIENNSTIYLGADTLENGKWAGTLVHEYTHFAEGTKEYIRLIKFLSKDEKLFAKAAQHTANAGYLTSNMLDTIISKVESDTKLTADEARAYNTFKTEINANMVETLLGNEDFINKIVRENTTIAEKVMNKINDLKAMFKSLDNAESRAEYKQLQKAEKLYLKAVESAGYRYYNRKIVSLKREDVDTQEEIQYNNKEQFSKKNSLINKTFPPYNESLSEANERAIRWAKQETIMDGWQKLVSYHDKWYVIEKFSDMEYGYLIVETVNKNEFNRIADRIKSYEGALYEESIDEGISLYENGGGKQGVNSVETQNRQANNRVSQMAKSRNTGESSGKQTRQNSGESSRNKQRNEVKYSLKDSVEKDYGFIDEWFESLSQKDLQELVQDIDDIDKITIEKIESNNNETRLSYINKLYENKKLDSLITKIAKKKPAMWDYFKNSKMNKRYNPLFPTKNDELIVMFHGSPNKFYSFDSKRIGKNGTVFGSGYYFTESKDYAEGYSNTQGGNVIAALLKIEKPLSRNQYTISKQQIKTFVREVVDNNGEDWLSNYGDVAKLGYEQLLNKAINEVYGYNKNDVDLIESIFVESRIDFDEFHSKLTEKLGYDGIISWNKAEGTQAIIFNSNQAKDIFNYNPTENKDIRYSLKANEPIYKLTKGQLKKIIANNTKYKVYTKADSEEIINNVLSNYMAFGEKYGDLSGKNKKEVIDMLWKGLNSANQGYQMVVAFHIADYIIQNGMLENIYNDEDSAWAFDTIDILKPYLHKLDLDSIKEEIKNKYDTDKSPYLLWGKSRGSKGVTLDALSEKIGNIIQIESINNADTFFQVDELYRSAINALKKKSKTILAEGLSDVERKDLRQEIAKEVVRGFDYTGGDSKLANIVNIYSERIRALKDELQNEKTRNLVVNRLLDKTQKLKDLKLGIFINATEFKTDIFKGSIEKLASIKYRGDLNQAGTRKIVAGLEEWYVESNPILDGVYENDIASALNEIVNGVGMLTTDELRSLSNIVDYFKHFIETYNKIYRNGKYVEALPIAESYINTLRENKAIKVGWFNKVTGSAYVKIFGDPMTVARRMDLYESGFYTEMLESLRNATVAANIEEMEVRTELDEFLANNKNYLKDAEKRTINYLGEDIPLMDALYVYLALGRKQAQLGLEKSGFTYDKDKETIRINGFGAKGFNVETAIAEIEKQLSETDKQYLAIAKKIFNEKCRELKNKTDIIRKGYSNISDEEYVPIRRANIYHNVDSSTFIDEVNRASNASFNKDIVKKAKQELIVEPLNKVLDRHIRGVVQYANLATTIDEYNKLFSLDIGGNKNKPISVATESQNTWKDGNEYFKKLISDIQGIPVTKGVGNKAMSFVRGSYAKYQLGANPKVWLTQLSSFAAAGSMLDIKSIIKGIGVNSNDVDEYCSLAKLRNNDNTAAMAQGVIDKVDKVGNFLMKPIGAVDRFVIKKLFGACQVQVEKETGLQIGTKENKIKAGELLNKVILETQQNSMATERSAAMRSGSEFMKTITMFSADAMKVVGRVIDAAGELSTLIARKKRATDPAIIAKLDKRIKASQKKTVKSVASLVASATMMALIAQLFRTLYNKDDEDTNIAQNVTLDAVGNLLGGLPLVRDVYARFTDGYDIDGYAYSALNELLDTGVSIFNTAGDIFSGTVDGKNVALNIKKMTYAAGQVLGLPTRNVYNIAYGLTKRISPSTAYKIDDMFYKQSYSSDLAKAIENEDDSMIATVVGIMLDENIGEIKETSVRKELNSLVSNGYKVLPKSIGNTITYEGEEITLTNNQKKQFKAVYNDANSKVASLITLSQYKSATEQVRANAIKYIYDIFYNLALEDLLGVDLENKNILFASAIDIEKLAIIIASVKELTADTDKNGRTISGTKKAKVQAYINSLQLTAVQKYMIMGYLGYTNKYGQTQVKAYINTLSLTKSEKANLLEYSGYKTK